jgi:deoxyribonuclease V
MILAMDVAYRSAKATVAGVLFRDWADERPEEEMIISCPVPERYVPGNFYLRELPCLAALLKTIPELPRFIIIDGFVYLGREKKPGLGKHLHDLLKDKATIIGVAKSPFADTPRSCELLRGRSRKPLFVTAAGLPGSRAKILISKMHGKGRIPTLLRRADRLCRSAGRCHRRDTRFGCGPLFG